MKNKKIFLYTFIFWHTGGTYISQVWAKTSKSAIKNWQKRLKDENQFSKDLLKQLKKELKDEVPIRIKNTINVVCMSVLLNDKLGIINLIKTDKNE